MTRALVALLVASSVAAFGWGGPVGAVLILPFVLLVAVFVGIPLLVTFIRAGWLRWWQALIAGVLCGATYPLLDYITTYGANLDRLLSANNLSFVGVGALVGVAVWCAGVYRNPVFPSVPTALPRSMVLLVPIVALGILLHRFISPNLVTGRVVAVHEASIRDAPQESNASVRVGGQLAVVARIHAGSQGRIAPGQCVQVLETWSARHWRRNRELFGPIDDHRCGDGGRPGRSAVRHRDRSNG